MINEFKKEYAFLSNFYYCSIIYQGHCYPTVEHAFQAAKTTNPVIAQKIQFVSSPAEAKKMGRNVDLRKDWEDVKLQIMVELVRDKFQTHKDLRNKLLGTGQEELIEGNYWHDNYWGICNCDNCKNVKVGKNFLGQILMVERDFQAKTRDHIFVPVPNMELYYCCVCGGSEGTLTTHCCGRHVTAEENQKIYNEGILDFRNGEWVNLPNYKRGNKKN